MTMVRFLVVVGAAMLTFCPGPTFSQEAAAGKGLRGQPPAGTAAPANLWTRQQGVDWPKFLGPGGDGKSPETGLVAPWPERGPRIVWHRPVGIGYGIGSVSAGRYYHYDRVGNEARVSCLRAETGELLWTYKHPTRYFDMYGYDGGPRASPVIDEDRVYLFGVEGLLFCLNAFTGAEIWKVDTMRQFGVVQNFFGVGSTPVIDGDLLIAMIGGSDESSQQIPTRQLELVTGNGSGIVAFDKRTGAVKYRLTDQLASYASPQLATVNNRRWCFAFCRGGLVGFDPRSGKVDFEFPWRARMLESVNASTPVVVGNQVLITEAYSIGSAMLEFRPEAAPRVIWEDSKKARSKSLKCHWNTPIEVDGYLYGCSGRHSPESDLRCVNWKTGEVQWIEPLRIWSTLIYVDGHFICLSEDGHLQLLRANPKEFELVSEVDLMEPAAEPQPAGVAEKPLLRQPCWAAPILAHGLMFVRGDNRLACLELIPERRPRDGGR
jgi:outer membrane protein assembly factor BamB